MTTEGPFSRYLAAQPRWAVLLESCLLVLLIGYVDYITGYEITITTFYALPILLAIWYADRFTAIIVAFLCGATWFLADFCSGHVYSAAWIAAWDTWMRLVFFIFVVFGGGAIKAQVAETRARVLQLEPFHVLAAISPVGIFRTDLLGRCLYMNQRWIEIAGESARSLKDAWTHAVHPDDRERIGREWEEAAKSGRSFQFECRFCHRDDDVAWVIGHVAPERDGHNVVRGYVGAITEITEHRRLETEVLEISEREQRRIGQDLHDGLCQDLAAIQFYAATLKSDLQKKFAPEAVAAAEITDLLKEAIVQARNFARAIFPVKLEHIGLASALEELAGSVSRIYRVDCAFESSNSISVYDHASASNLYRIAQEAVNNAIKHGKAETITIALGRMDHRLTLTIVNDGVDFPADSISAGGMGLHIMRYRARMIGASFLVQKTPGGGTLVSCTLREEPARDTLAEQQLQSVL